MDELLDAIAALVSQVSPEKVQAIAARIRRTEASKAASTLPSVVGTPVATIVVEQLAAAWQNTEVGSDELASMLLAACHVYSKAASEQSTELVWTGPTTPFVSARRTEQALLQVINSAQNNLFLTSFVAFEVPTIVLALKSAVERGVIVSMLLELSEEYGGSVTVNSIEKMRKLLPRVIYYCWRHEAQSYNSGRVHAKVAVADGALCFITSANLTGYAMERNIEIGVLLEGAVPRTLHEHLNALVLMRILSPMS